MKYGIQIVPFNSRAFPLSRVITDACEREEQTTDYCDMHFPLIWVLKSYVYDPGEKNKGFLRKNAQGNTCDSREIKRTTPRDTPKPLESLRLRVIFFSWSTYQDARFPTPDLLPYLT